MGGAMRRVAAAGLAVFFLGAAALAEAETQTERIVAEQRTSLSVRIAPEAAQSLLPDGWTVNAGPQASNLSLNFMDRKLALNAEGKLLGSGVNRLLVMSMAAKNVQTGEVRTMIVGGYSADPAGSPGAYRVYGRGSVDLIRSEHVDGVASNMVEERWTVTAEDGGVLNISLSFERGVPTLNPFELKIHSAAAPDFYRIYRGQQAVDVLRNAASGVDRVASVSVEAAGGKLGEIFKDVGAVLAASNSPFYGRETFLP